MSVSLSDVTYDANQDPVGVNRPFTIKLLLFASSDDAQRSGTVTLWTRSAYAVVPNQVNVTVAAGSSTAEQDVSIELRGTPQKELVRIYAECDERHSVFVRVQ
jgi:hypothetical protein